MPRMARIVLPGVPHHITHRGNYQQTIFDGPEDYEVYLRIFKTAADRYGTTIWGYALMANHSHHTAVPERADSLARTFNLAGMSYARYLHKKRAVKGHLFESRFFSCPMEGAHCLRALRYIERNPVRAGRVERPEEYRWSSARAHILGEGDPLLTDCPLIPSRDEWAAFVQAEDDPTWITDLRHNTKIGLPTGSDAFIGELETLVGRSLRRRAPGAPRKRPAKPRLIPQA